MENLEVINVGGIDYSLSGGGALYLHTYKFQDQDTINDYDEGYEYIQFSIYSSKATQLTYDELKAYSGMVGDSFYAGNENVIMTVYVTDTYVFAGGNSPAGWSTIQINKNKLKTDCTIKQL